MKRSHTIESTSAEAAAFLEFQGSKGLLDLERGSTGARYETRSRQQARDAIAEIVSMADENDENGDDGSDSDDEIDEWDEIAERRNLRTVFRVFARSTPTLDCIDEESATQVFRSLGITPEKAKIRELVAKVGRDGKVSLDGFVEFMIERRKGRLSEAAKKRLAEQQESSSSSSSSSSSISSSPSSRGRSKSPVRKAKKSSASKSPSPRPKKTAKKSAKSPSSSPKHPSSLSASPSSSPKPAKKAVPKKTSPAVTAAAAPRVAAAPKPKLSAFYNDVETLSAATTTANPEGDAFNLGVKGAFNDFHVLVYNGLATDDSATERIQLLLASLSASLGLHFEVSVSIADLYRRLSGGEADTMDALWVISSSSNGAAAGDEDDLWKDVTEDEFASALDSFHKSGRGVALFATAGGKQGGREVNAVLNKLFNNDPSAELVSELTEAAVLSLVPSGPLSAPASFRSHAITTGLVALSESPAVHTGLPVSSVAFSAPGGFAPVALSSSSSSETPSSVVLAVKETDSSLFPPSGRVVLDTSFSKFLTEGQGVSRLVSNVAVWLLGVDVRLSSALPLRGPLNKMKCDYVWQYYHSGWYNYEKNASKTVEECYQQYLLNPGKCDVRSVQSGHFSYQVDFINMKQTNVVHHAHTQRKIRRVPVSMSVY